jgi:hypothetical protein
MCIKKIFLGNFSGFIGVQPLPSTTILSSGVSEGLDLLTATTTTTNTTTILVAQKMSKSYKTYRPVGLFITQKGMFFSSLLVVVVVVVVVENSKISTSETPLPRNFLKRFFLT